MRPRQTRLPADGICQLRVQPLEQLVHHPARDQVALARVDEAEVEHRDEQHFPVQLHARDELRPVDVLRSLQDHVRDIGAVVAVAVLDVDLRPDELRRRNEVHLGVEQRASGASWNHSSVTCVAEVGMLVMMSTNCSPRVTRASQRSSTI